MDLLDTAANIVRRLKKLPHAQRIEVLDLARKQFEYLREGEERAAKEEAQKVASAPQTVLNAEGLPA